MAGKNTFFKRANAYMTANHPDLPQLVPEHVDAFLTSIVEILAEGGRVQFHGFGSFYRKIQAGRRARNPSTMQNVSVEPRAKISLLTKIEPFPLTPVEQEALDKRRQKGLHPVSSGTG